MSTVTTETAASTLEIALPPAGQSLTQDREWCVVHWEGEWRKVAVHDYETIFSIPGLYERLIYDVLDCRSPSTVRKLLEEELAGAKQAPSDICAVDLGAGNGMVADELNEMGADSVIGVDIIEEARKAADRDYPGVYEDYHVLDMARITDEQRELFLRHRPNCLVCVAALGFADIPPEAFRNAFNLIRNNGWVAFNIKEEFLGKYDETGFARLVWLLESMGALKIKAKHRYQHRLGTDGNPIPYVAVVGRKMFDAPAGDARPSDS